MIILLPKSSFVLRICFPTCPEALLGTLYLFMNFPARSAQNRTENGNPEAQVSPWPHILISITLPLKTVRSICCSLIISWAYLDQSQTWNEWSLFYLKLALFSPLSLPCSSSHNPFLKGTMLKAEGHRTGVFAPCLHCLPDKWPWTSHALFPILFPQLYNGTITTNRQSNTSEDILRD